MATPFILLVLWCTCRPSCSVYTGPEWFHNISTSLFSLSGDIMLGGLFPINQLSSNISQWTEPDSITCESLNEFGLGLAIVMKFAVDEINANQILLPGIKLGYEIYDTCQQSAIVVRPTLSFLTAKSNKALTVECNYTSYETSISAVIGPQSSEMMSMIGKLLGFFMMPQISYGVTSVTYSDSVQYPSFFRTVPSDKGQVKAMTLLLAEFSWNWVAVVGSDEEYGQQGVQQFSTMAEQMSICVAYQGLIPVYTDPHLEVSNIVYNIKLNKVGVVVVFSLVNQAKILFEEVIRRNVTAVWIASSSWVLNNLLTSLPNIQTVGTIIGFIDKTQPVDLLNSYTWELFTKISEKRGNLSTPEPNSGNITNPCPQCWDLSPANISLVTDTAVQHSAFSVYAAVYTAAQALHNMLGCNSTACKWGSDTKIYPWKLSQVLRNTSVDINGTHLVFNSSDPNIGFDLIQWVWTTSGVDFMYIGSFYDQLSINASRFNWYTENGEVPQSTCSAACAIGQVRRVKGFHSCCFDCVDCLPGTYQANEDDIQCTPCEPGQWSLSHSTNCTYPTFDIFSWDTPAALWLIMLVVVLLIYYGSVGVMFLQRWGTPLVQASGGAMGIVVLLGMMGACLSQLLFLGQPGDTVCRLQLPLICIFQTVTLSMITSISLQIFYVTEFPGKAASFLHILRGPGSWLIVLVCCAVQAGICAWFVEEGPSLSVYLETMDINFVRAFLSCPVSPLFGFALMQGFNTALALISFMCTFMAAKPLHQYNLARDITFCSLIYCVLWVIFIPIYIALNNKNQSIVYIYFTLTSNLGLVAAYYFPKCYLLLKEPDLNTPEHFCTFLEGVPSTPAQEEAQPQPQCK